MDTKSGAGQYFTTHTLEELDKQKGLLGLIFTKSQNEFDSRSLIAALTLQAPICVQFPVRW